jgi:cell division protein FtsN
MNQHGASRMDTILKMLLIAFISLLAFSSGVYFGKQMSDSDYQLKALESDFNSHSKSANAKAMDVSPEDAIADDEVNTLSEKYVNAEKDQLKPVEEKGAAKADGEKEAKAETKAESKGEARKVASTGEGEEAASPAAKTGEAKAEGKPDLSAAHKAATRIANNALPTEEAKAQQQAKEPTRQPTSLPRTVGPTADVEFTVQVASYPTSDAAKEHAGDLVKKGFPAFPVEAKVNGKVWYRVSVGSFKTMKEATTYRAQLLKQADLQSAIVQRIQR